MPAYEYVVVEFPDEGSVEVIHKTWLESEDEGMFCYWPRKNYQQNAKKGQIPDKDIWRKYPIRIFSYTDNYEKALERRQRALDSSNVDTNDEEVPQEVTKRAVRPPHRLGREYDSASDEEENRTQRRDEDRRTTSPRPPTPPMFIPSYHGKTSNRHRSRSPVRRSASDSVRRSTPDSVRRSTPDSVRRSTPGPSDVDRRQESWSPVRRPHILPDLDQRDNQEVCGTSRKTHCLDDQVKMSLARVERTLLEHSQMLRRILNGQPSGSADGDADLDDLIPTAIQTVDELSELSGRFIQDGDFSKKLVRFLGALGGNNIGDAVRRIMRRIGSNSLWSVFSLKGKNQKKSLKAEPVYKIISKACIRVHNDAKESEIDEAMSDFLRHAPHQAGGLKYKKPAAKNMPTTPVLVASNGTQEETDNDS